MKATDYLYSDARLVLYSFCPGFEQYRQQLLTFQKIDFQFRDMLLGNPLLKRAFEKLTSQGVALNPKEVIDKDMDKQTAQVLRQACMMAVSSLEYGLSNRARFACLQAEAFGELYYKLINPAGRLNIGQNIRLELQYVLKMIGKMGFMSHFQRRLRHHLSVVDSILRGEHPGDNSRHVHVIPP